MQRWKKRGGEVVAMQLIVALCKEGLFRERDLEEQQISHNWLNIACERGLVRRYGCGVWSAASYVPTRYELAQFRFPRAVFWGPSALWLQGEEAEEPETLWVAISNHSRVPRTFDPTTVVIRTRTLEADVVTVCPDDRKEVVLRAHSVERARRDIAGVNFLRMLERAADRSQFRVPPNATLLSSSLKRAQPPWPSLLPREDWVAT